MRHWLISILVSVCALALGGGALAAEQATAQVIGADGADRGTVEFQTTQSGVQVRAKLRGLPAGVHGFHIHAIGKCEPPFDSAGPHFNPQHTAHGILSPGGGHAGDLPNLQVPTSGVVNSETLVAGVALTADSLLDADGASIVVHAGPDDYATDPSGNSGARIACGVITP